MNRFLALFVLLAVGLSLWISQVESNQLLFNGGFENGLNGWTTGVGSWPFSLSVFGQGHNSNYSATDIVDSVSGLDYWGQIYQEVLNITSNTTVYATLFARSNITPIAAAKTGLLLQFLNSNNTVIGSQQDEIGGQTNWRYLYIATRTPSGTAKIRFSGYLFAPQNDNSSVSGQCWIDDAVLSSDFIQPPPPQTRLINPGFENGLNDWTDVFGFPSEISTNIKHSGNYAAKKTVATVSNQDYWSQIGQELAVTEGRPYTAKLWVKTDMSVEARAVAGLIIQFVDENGQVVGPSLQQQVGGQTNWELLEVSDTVPTGAVKVRFSGFIWAPEDDLPSLGGIAYYDDASFNSITIHHRVPVQR